MRYVVIEDGKRFKVRDTVDPDGDVSGVSTRQRADAIAARLNDWLGPVG